jgi:hypothetical protein
VADSAAQRHPHVIAGPSSDFTPGAVEQIDDTPPRNSSDTSLAGPTVRIPFAPAASQQRTASPPVWVFLIITLPLTLPGIISGMISPSRQHGRVRRHDHFRL